MAMSSDDTAAGAPSDPLFTTLGNDNIAPTAFYILNWVFFALCLIAFLVRAYIRYACFRRLVLEDYIMFTALLLHTAESILIQLFVGYMYDVEAVNKGDTSKVGRPDFFPNARKGVGGMGASVSISVVGVLIIKINFLLFFKKLGAGIRRFDVAWWCVLAFTIGGLIAQLAMMGTMEQFTCFFGSAEYIFSDHCGSPAASRRIIINAIFNCVVDAVADILIVCFPIWILWDSGISTRKKIHLTFVFSLVWLTVAITIVRGSVFHEQYSASTGETVQIQSGTFTWFWFYAEFSVAFVIACMVSFRSLFVQRANKSSAERERAQRREAEYRSAMRRARMGVHGSGSGNGSGSGGDGSWWREKFRAMHDSVLDTCRTLEGYPGKDDDTFGLPTVPSGLMTVNFVDDSNWKKNAVAMTATSLSSTTARGDDLEYGRQAEDSRFERVSAERPVSAQSLLESPQAAHVKQDVGIAR
ncbi:hypothetical protein VTK26DRAFT_2359 [Humicola hyalothermophila]